MRLKIAFAVIILLAAGCLLFSINGCKKIIAEGEKVSKEAEVKTGEKATKVETRPTPNVDVPVGFVQIPAGWFQMGCVPGNKECGDDEKPRKRVYVDAFYLEVHEVTVAEYSKCVDAGVCKTPYTKNPSSWDKRYEIYEFAYNWGTNRSDHPINGVDWYDAKTYCEWRNTRLPTEAEFEKVLRGGEEGKKYPWGDSSTPPSYYGNYADESAKRTLSAWISGYADGYVGTSPVCAMAKNPYGLCDISGNIYEWCADWYAEDWYSRMPERNPENEYESQHRMRIVRGGGWFRTCVGLRASARGRYPPATGSFFRGFRCARD